MPITALPTRALCCPAGKMAACTQAQAKNLLAGLAPRWPPCSEQPRAWVQANARRTQTLAVLASDYVCVPQAVRLEFEIKMERPSSEVASMQRKVPQNHSCFQPGWSAKVSGHGRRPNWTLCRLGSTADGPSAGPATAVLLLPRLPPAPEYNYLVLHDSTFKSP